MTDTPGLVFRWLWGLFHLAGLLSWAIGGPEYFALYLWVFVVLELAGILFGRPMTHSVRGILDDSRRHRTWGTVAAFFVALWCYVFAIGATLYGPFPVPVNAFLTVLIFFVWIGPHFLGDRWG